MHRRAQSGSEKQLPLELDATAQRARESALRAAYVRLRLSARLSFEQVMAESACAIGIRNLADAMARRRAGVAAR